jgi:hypothetical protein
MNELRLLAVAVLVAWVAVGTPDVAGLAAGDRAAGDRFDQHNPCNPKIRKC